MGWIDGVILGVLLLSALLGIWRGLAFELLSLLGWVVAWFCAKAWGPAIAAFVPLGPQGSALRIGIGFLAAFLVGLMGWRLLSWLVQQLLQATPLAPLDRALGAAFGLLRGVLIVLLLVTLGGLTPLAGSPGWQQSQGVLWARGALAALEPLWPLSNRTTSAVCPPGRPPACDNLWSERCVASWG